MAFFSMCCHTYIKRHKKFVILRAIYFILCRILLDTEKPKTRIHLTKCISRHTWLYTLVCSVYVSYVRVPLASSKFIWKFAKFILYRRSLSLQSLRTLSLPIRIDRNDRNNATSLYAAERKFSIPKLFLLLH